MRHYKIFTVALCALFFIGCNVNSGGSGSTEKNTASQRTPTETLKALNEASKKKDPAAIKKLLSKGTLVLLDNAALSANTTSDELLKKDDGAPFQELPEIRGEKIEGDTAIVMVKNDVTSENENIPLVKEDGEWKVALDKYLDELKQRFTEEMNKVKDAETPASNSNSNSVEAPKENKTNSATNKK
ncbi:MAG: nuclear transport factor 2 family protein [Pyrinomonadaceae bacterium]